jgi:hypothetical protein
MPRVLFTRETAAEMARRSNAVQAERRRENGILHRDSQTVASTADHATPNRDTYAAMRLARVRDQLNRIDQMMQSEKDPQKLDRLAAASMRLSDQEFALAGRPKPGNCKPAPARRTYYLPPPTPIQEPPRDLTQGPRELAEIVDKRGDPLDDATDRRLSQGKADNDAAAQEATPPPANPPPSPPPVAVEVAYGIQLSPENWVPHEKTPQMEIAPGTANQIGLLRQQRLRAEAQRQARVQRQLMAAPAS